MHFGVGCEMKQEWRVEKVTPIPFKKQNNKKAMFGSAVDSSQQSCRCPSLCMFLESKSLIQELPRAIVK